MNVTLDLRELCDKGIIDESWAIALSPVQPRLNELALFLQREAQEGVTVLPEPQNIMRVFGMPVDAVRVLIVGQDPYPTPGHAIGLSFAVNDQVKPLPRSLNNIFTELESDTGIPRPASGDLAAWSRQGVMLLNRVLTVRAGEAGSHRGHGWEAVTERAINVLVNRKAAAIGEETLDFANPGVPLVAILWGKQAALLRPLLAETPVVESAHPSPLSARRGFFGSRPFTKTNELLSAQGAAPINWSFTGTKPPPLG